MIRGARILATLGPLSDEIAVFPSTVLRAAAETAPFAFAFAIPCETPGLRFICRESFDYSHSTFDHPLGARFEEMDAVVIVPPSGHTSTMLAARATGVLPLAGGGVVEDANAGTVMGDGLLVQLTV